MKRTTNQPHFMFRTCLGVGLLAAAALAVVSARADVKYVTTWSYTGGTAAVTPWPAYQPNPLGLTQTISASGSTAIVNPPGVDSARTRCVYGYAGAVNWQIQPATTEDGGIYRIEVAHTAVSSCTPDARVTAFSADGTVSASCTNSPVFQRSYGGDVWNVMGYITNNPGVTSPTIIFYYVDGTLNNSGTGRLYIDAFKFTLIDLCDGVVGDAVITGPLAANQTFVNVSGITAGATNITVYANDQEIGQTNYAAGFAAGTVTVPVTVSLSKDWVIKATQSKLNALNQPCTSTYPESGVVVGGGANPQIKVSLGCGVNASLTGPAGADTGGAVVAQYWVKATALSGGSASAPVGGQVVMPGDCWQTITFDFANDPKLFWQSGNAYPAETNAYTILEHLAFALDTDVADSGDYDIYVDDIRNGDVVIENFEGWNAGDAVTFANPNTAALPGAGATYLGAPNSAAISQVNAYQGSNSCRIRWQFRDAGAVRWARVLASQANGATYPQLDTSKPVTVRLLVLPVGATTNKLSVGTLPNQTKSPGQSVTFTAAPKGVSPFTYQWKKNGTDIGGATQSTYSIGSVAMADAGKYSVVVDNSACEPVESAGAQLTVQQLAASVNITGIAGTAINYTGGAGAQFVLLKSADVAAAAGAWTRVATNTVTPGSFTIPAVGTDVQAYYRIKSE